MRCPRACPQQELSPTNPICNVFSGDALAAKKAEFFSGFSTKRDNLAPSGSVDCAGAIPLVAPSLMVPVTTYTELVRMENDIQIRKLGMPGSLASQFDCISMALDTSPASRITLVFPAC